MIFAYLFMPPIGTENGSGDRSQELKGFAFSPELTTIKPSRALTFREELKCSH